MFKYYDFYSSLLYRQYMPYTLNIPLMLRVHLWFNFIGVFYVLGNSADPLMLTSSGLQYGISGWFSCILLLMTLLLLSYSANTMVVNRVNYGVMFPKETTVRVFYDYWTHTVQMSIPRFTHHIAHSWHAPMRKKLSPWAHGDHGGHGSGPNDHGSVTARRGHSSVTARSQLSHG